LFLAIIFPDLLFFPITISTNHPFFPITSFQKLNNFVIPQPVSSEINKPHDPYAALRIRDFSVYMIARFCLTLGVQIQGVVVGIQIYKLAPGTTTDKAQAMGYIGLAEAIPFIVLAIFAGHIADVVRRKKIILFSTGFLLICSWLLFYITAHKTFLSSSGTLPIYGIIFCTGIARGFLGPVFPAFLSQLIPRSLYQNATTWNSNLWQTAAVLGPALGGLLLGFFGTKVAYAVSSSLITMSFLTIMFVKNHPLPIRETKEKLHKSLTAGIRFVFGNQILLSALCLDLFAVLLGGAVAMIPIFAHEILNLGDKADMFVGFMRAAPAAGSILMGLLMAYFPPTKKAGRNLYMAVTGFGICIICFAFSTNVYLSLFLLLLSGSFDMVSVVIRQTVLQLLTPDNMRGRVSAVNGIFIGSSNEIGEFESGKTAKWMGLIPSVAFGGCMTVIVVSTIMMLAPKLRKLNLNEHV
jgi:MFS family permease